MRAKFDKLHYQEHALFVKKLGSHAGKGGKGALGSTQKDVRSEWLPLSKFRVASDVSRGYVSI